jgi:hypothetical protein
MLERMGEIGRGYDEAWDPALLGQAASLSAAVAAVALLAAMRLFR